MTVLRREPEDCELETAEKKAQLAERFKNVLESDGLDPELFLFSDNTCSAMISSLVVFSEIFSIKNKVYSVMSFMEAKIKEMEKKIEER